jgi:calpain, invertebrate
MIDIVTPNTSGKIPLLRLRNPWGNEAEWNGAWSDKSSEWRYIPDHAKEEIGEFYYFFFSILCFKLEFSNR